MIQTNGTDLVKRNWTHESCWGMRCSNCMLLGEFVSGTRNIICIFNLLQILQSGGPSGTLKSLHPSVTRRSHRAVMHHGLNRTKSSRKTGDQRERVRCLWLVSRKNLSSVCVPTWTWLLSRRPEWIFYLKHGANVAVLRQTGLPSCSDTWMTPIVVPLGGVLALCDTILGELFL